MKKPYRIRVAEPYDYDDIFRLRHEVYARDLGQYEVREDGMLVDPLVDHNVYLIVEGAGGMIGFISVTPPTAPQWSLERYFSWDQIPWTKDETLYEIRAMTLHPEHRGGWLCSLLVYAGLRWAESQGGKRLIAMVRDKVQALDSHYGMVPLGITQKVGRVDYMLMGQSISAIRERLDRFHHVLERMRRKVEWQLPFAFRYEARSAKHGGAFFEAIGPTFQSLEKRADIINADVLDAWFAPAPEVLTALHEPLDWLTRTSPPVYCEGMMEVIARACEVPPSSLLPGSGSSRLIYLAFPQWLNTNSRALLVEPTYSEYPFVLEKLIRCDVDRWTLDSENGYALDFEAYSRTWGDGYDMVVIVNPNNPTGNFIPREQLQAAIENAPETTTFWIDEAYIDYIGEDQSLESFASTRRNVCVCKSLSKVYALSGLRAAYLCSHEDTIAGLRRWLEPWPISLPAQVAAVRAFQAQPYYQARYQETKTLREMLSRELNRIQGLQVVAGNANFLLVELNPSGRTAAELIEACANEGLYLRDVTSAGGNGGDKTVRIAVKDKETNRRMIETISRVIQSWDDNADQFR